MVDIRDDARGRSPVETYGAPQCCSCTPAPSSDLRYERPPQRGPGVIRSDSRCGPVVPRLAKAKRGHRCAAFRLMVVIASAGLAVVVAGCGSSSGSPQEATRFLETYARPDGRVVRLDQGKDTVSEGQAYGMLLAEVTGNTGAFNRIWTWTQRHLQLSNYLFAFHANAAGQVISTEPASDADLLIAWALLRYHGPDETARHRDGRQVADAVLAHEVVTGEDGMPVLTAGPWATGQIATIDPSYWSLAAFQGLAKLTGNQTWLRLESGAVSLARALTRDGRQLPPDWAQLRTGDAPVPEPSPNGSAPVAQYGLDAQRTVVWFAASCNPQARALAARWWRLLRPERAARALALHLNGNILIPTHAPLPLVAAAAAATAAGQSVAAQQLLSDAAAQQLHYPTYYGGAWSALGHALLLSDALNPCSGRGGYPDWTPAAQRTPLGPFHS
jgi:endo-1,4-beta-D-glucanase Y